MAKRTIFKKGQKQFWCVIRLIRVLAERLRNQFEVQTRFEVRHLPTNTWPHWEKALTILIGTKGATQKWRKKETNIVHSRGTEKKNFDWNKCEYGTLWRK